MKNVIIIGGGCSGLTAAIYLKRANFNVKVFCNYCHGNLTTTQRIENFPGFPNGISGVELLYNMVEQCQKIGVQICDNEIIKIENNFKYVIDDCQQQHKYDILLLATGLKHRETDFKQNKKYKNIHRCATCDGAFYKDKQVAVLGGGNTALQDALYLSNICKKVYLIHRRNQFRAEQCIVDQILRTSNITLILNSQITEVTSNNENSNKFNQVFIVNTQNKELGSCLDVDALFVAIGFNANLNLILQYFTDYHYINNKLYFNNGDQPIYICGDVNTKYHQAIIACGDGANVAMQIIQENR